MHPRRATISDANAIAAVHVSSWRETYRGHLPQPLLDSLSIEERARLWRFLLGRPELDTYVVEGEVVVAFCNLAPSRDPDARPDVGEIGALYVEPTSWRRGHGRQLIEAVAARASGRGMRSLTLWVLRENEPARSFYEAMGFVPDGMERLDDTISGAPLHDVRYGITLEGTQST